MLSRREAIAALASTAALPLMAACGRDRAPTPPGNKRGRCARAARRGCRQSSSPVAGERDLAGHRHRRESGASIPARRSLRGGQQRLAKQLRADLERVNAFDTSGLSHATRTSFEVVRSAYATALEGFALPYGDITVGGWRNTPYVVIQNVGAYLDIPRFLDSDHRIENAADAEAYLARLQSYAKQLDGELGRMQAARAAGLVPPAFLIDKALGADDALGEERARRRVARRVDRAAVEKHSRQLGRARADDRRAGDRAGARAAAPRAAGTARRRDERRRDLRLVRTARSSTGGRSRPRPPRPCRPTRSTRWARANWSACTRRWTRS